MKYSLLMIIFLMSSTAQASYCSGKNWQDAYQFYTHNIDLLNQHIDSYNVLLGKGEGQTFNNENEYESAKLVITELDQLSVDVENLASKFNKVKQLWQIISTHCLMDDELDYNHRAIENARGADIGRREVNDLLARIELLRQRFLTAIELANDNRHMLTW